MKIDKNNSLLGFKPVSQLKMSKATRAKYDQGLSVVFSADEVRPCSEELSDAALLVKFEPRCRYWGQQGLKAMAYYEPGCSPRTADLLAQSENPVGAQNLLLFFVQCIKQEKIQVPAVQLLRASVDLITLSLLQTTTRSVFLRPHTRIIERPLSKGEIPAVMSLLKDALDVFPRAYQVDPVESISYLKFLQERNLFQSAPDFKAKAEGMIASCMQCVGADLEGSSAQHLFNFSLLENADRFNVTVPPYER